MKKTVIIILVVLLIGLSIAAVVLANKNKNKPKEANEKPKDKDGKPVPKTKGNGAAPTLHTISKSAILTEKTNFPLKYGSRGMAVKMLQIYLGFRGKDVDGVWGNKTENEMAASFGFNDFYKEDFIKYIITPAYSSTGNDGFNLFLAKSNGFIAAVQVALGYTGANITGHWGNSMTGDVQKAIGKDEISPVDYDNMISLAIGIEDAQSIAAATTVINNNNPFGGTNTYGIHGF